ncbi:MAG: dihydroorotate dehydrogenase electron transfer subunit [Candidatus Howiella sp.]|jgi:dihydroorotate dehydrogenase electron transfer subunit
MGYTKALGTVLSNRRIADGIYDMTVRTPQATAASIGQFMQVYCEGKTLRRPISICEFDPKAETIRLVYLVKGEGTRWMSTLSEGETIDLLGPLGHGFSLKRADRPVVIGGGIGTPPMLAVAQAAGGRAEAILGFKNQGAVILMDEFEAACAHVALATDDGSAGQKGFVTDILAERMKTVGYDLILACGPIPMLRAVAGLAEKAGVACQVSLEERMGCGIGACVGCVCKVTDGKDVRHAQVCRYGPVIDAKEVVW